MINFYAYTYPDKIKLIENHGGLQVKLGDTHRDPAVRMAEQGGASEPEKKIVIKIWSEVTTIDRDYILHKVLKDRGLRRTEDDGGILTGKGTEWFTIPISYPFKDYDEDIDNILDETQDYLDDLFDEVGGSGTSKKNLILRPLQQKKLEEALKIIAECARNGQDVTNLIANLCPRFGKTVWALMLFNKITELYGNDVMLLPAYWLSVHGSFKDEIETFKEFMSIESISMKDVDPKNKFDKAVSEGKRVILEMSLHGNLKDWKIKHDWISNIDNDRIFVFSDEADFGSHTENQVDKLRYIFA